MAAAQNKVLFVFDFDHTVVDANSDTWIYKCLENEALPNAVKSTYEPGTARFGRHDGYRVSRMLVIITLPSFTAEIARAIFKITIQSS